MSFRALLVLSSVASLSFAGEKPKEAPAAPKEFAVAKVTLTSGLTEVVNYRVAVPAKTNRADFAWRATTRCLYADRGDATGLPFPEKLKALMELEAKTEGPTALRVMSKTGQNARETVYQVKDHAGFQGPLVDRAKALGLECAVTIEKDAKWSQWEDAKKQLAKPKPEPKPQP